MRKNVSGFTIIELLIVIVIIAILAAITLVAYNSIQGRARDSIRYTDVKNIIKGLELYKVDHGVYPPNSPTTAANGPGGACGDGSYSYSFATDDSWMKPLVTGNYLTKVPTPPINDCTHYYRYYHPTATQYGCSFSSGYYVLQVQGIDDTITPDGLITSTNKPSSGSGCNFPWASGPNTWVFSAFD